MCSQLHKINSHNGGSLPQADKNMQSYKIIGKHLQGAQGDPRHARKRYNYYHLQVFKNITNNHYLFTKIIPSLTSKKKNSNREYKPL
jgi:hypothetical protein